MSARPPRPRRGTALAAASAAALATLVGVPSASADALDDGQWWRAAMGVDELNRAGTGAGVTVALIDGPIDSSVPEIEGRVASSSTECLGRGGAALRSVRQDVLADHATRMASLIVGSGRGTAPGGRGIAGIAPGATLRHYAVTFGDPEDPEKLSCGLRDPGVNVVGEATARAISRAVEDGAKVISISLTTDYSDAYAAALLDAYRAGAVVVASTNNDTRSVFWPGIGNGVVTVTHVDAAGNLDGSAARGTSLVDFAAPGTKVAAGAWTPSGWRSDVLSDGSSQATAITAGALAAIWSAHPSATGNQVLQAARTAIGLRAENGSYLTWFRRVGTDLPEAVGKTQSYGFGIISPADAVLLDVDALPRTSPMVADRGVVEPTAQEIAEATASGTPSAGAAPTVSASASPPAAGGATPGRTRDAAAVDTATDGDTRTDEGSPTVTWVVVAAVLLLVLVLGALRLARRPRPGARVDSGPVSPSPQTEDITAATGGVAATTKEHSHGGH